MRRLSGWLLPALLAACACAVIFVTLGDYGITWDEPGYLRAGISHGAWLRHPRIESINFFWTLMHEHPPLGSMLAGFSRYIFAIKLHWFHEFMAGRLQALIFVFVAIYALSSLVRDVYGPWLAAVAAILFFLLPRVFCDAHLIALDFPETAVWLAATWMFWKGLSRPRWMIGAGAAVGCAMLVKINGFFLYMLLPAWFVGYWAVGSLRKRQPLMARREALLALLALVGIPPLLFFASWPWLWLAPRARFEEYLLFQLNHSEFVTYYLGNTSSQPPWHYPFVMTAITIPLVTLAPLVLGLFLVPSGRQRHFNCFVLANALLPMLVVAFLTACKYDGVRLFLQAFPYLSIIAALGVARMFTWAQARGLKFAFGCVYGALFVISACYSTVRYHPYQSSYYNELVGGAKGAERSFELEYWGCAFKGALPWIRAHPDKSFWVPIAAELVNEYKQYGEGFGGLSASIRLHEARDGDYLILLVRQGMFSEELWDYARSERPLYSVTVAGAPLLKIYKIRPGARTSGDKPQAISRSSPL